ncbi:MAG TPA: hypothetical protein VN969_08125 [Streptosporangiaceae bacterium]|nr:hypothetical protein [Streptosporangiaceae bacterium]
MVTSLPSAYTRYRPPVREPAISHQTTRFEVEGLGEIDMVPMVLARLDQVTHDDAQRHDGHLADALRELLG